MGHKFGRVKNLADRLHLPEKFDTLKYILKPASFWIFSATAWTVFDDQG